ncbi:hypothetical protein B0H11DRAFT_1988926 [Mycena galericulata]|nr:hypothetical protein B0H11DRAFT_1988926 [Mycena galericulata]
MLPQLLARQSVGRFECRIALLFLNARAMAAFVTTYCTQAARPLASARLGLHYHPSNPSIASPRLSASGFGDTQLTLHGSKTEAEAEAEYPTEHCYLRVTGSVSSTRLLNGSASRSAWKRALPSPTDPLRAVVEMQRCTNPRTDASAANTSRGHEMHEPLLARRPTPGVRCTDVDCITREGYSRRAKVEGTVSLAQRLRSCASSVERVGVVARDTHLHMSSPHQRESERRRPHRAGYRSSYLRTAPSSYCRAHYSSSPFQIVTGLTTPHPPNSTSFPTHAPHPHPCGIYPSVECCVLTEPTCNVCGIGDVDSGALSPLLHLVSRLTCIYDLSCTPASCVVLDGLATSPASALSVKIPGSTCRLG